jgi:Fur family transcriptional regulator, ferric uptake regulator
VPQPVPGTATPLPTSVPGTEPPTSVPGTQASVPQASVPGTPAARALLRFERYLATKALRLTSARRAILEAVLARKGHFLIDALVEDLRARGIEGSKATVYRSLPLLTEAGILQEAVITGETKSYEVAVGREHHDHLVCRGCGSVVEFEFDAFAILEREVALRHGFRLEGHLHQLIGRCAECQTKEAVPGTASPVPGTAGEAVPGTCGRGGRRGWTGAGRRPR